MVKYTVSASNGIDINTGEITSREIKTFKGERNEFNALAFAMDAKNIRRYGQLSCSKRDQATGEQFVWDEEEGVWQTAVL